MVDSAARSPKQQRFLKLLLSLLIFTLVGQITPTEAAERPTYVIAFVPVHWSDGWDAFDAVAGAHGELFVQASGIARYADVSFRYIHTSFDEVPLDSPRLMAGMLAFGMLNEPADRYVGLTDGDLRITTRFDVAGYTFGPGSQGVLVESTEAHVTAHELGHTFSLCDEYLFDEWSRQDHEWGCPNPYPPACPPVPDQWCWGEPAPDGRHSIMGPAGLRGGYAFNRASYDHLQTVFTDLFGPTAPDEEPPPAVGLNQPIIVANPDLTLRAVDGSLYKLSEGPVWQPAVSADQTWIVFSAARHGTLDLFRVPVAGGQVERLTALDGREMHPVWLPQGDVLFVADVAGVAALFRLEMSTGAVVQLAGLPQPASWPAIAADGTQLVFTAAPDGQWDVYVVAIAANGTPDVGTLQRLTHDAAFEVAPAWSPAGDRLAFSSNRNGVLEVYALHLDSQEIVQVTTGGSAAWAAHWLDDGRLLLHTAHDGRMRVQIGDPQRPGQSVDVAGLSGAAWPVALAAGE